MATGYVKCACGNEFKPAISSTCPKCQRPASEAQIVEHITPMNVQVVQQENTLSMDVRDDSVAMSTEAQPRLHTEKVRLFDTPFYGDKVFFIGGAIVLVMAAINAYNSAHTSGIAHTGFGVVSGLIDGAVYLGVGFALFCLLPAFIRRSSRKGTLKNSTPSTMQAGTYPDPIASGRRRYWDGVKWTDQVTDYAHPRKTSGRAVAAGIVGALALLSVAGILGTQTGVAPIKASFDAIVADISAFSERSNSASTMNGGSAAWAAVLAEYAPILSADANEVSAAVNNANVTSGSVVEGVSGTTVIAFANALIGFTQAVANMNQGFITCGPNASACYDNVILTQRNAYTAAAQNMQTVAKTFQGLAN